jgi:hypothetical protein
LPRRCYTSALILAVGERILRVVLVGLRQHGSALDPLG